MERHSDQNGAVLSQRAIDGDDHPSLPAARSSQDGPMRVRNIRQSTHTVQITAHVAILAHFRTQIHNEKRRNDKTSSFQDPDAEHDKTSPRTQPQVLFADEHEQTQIISEPVRALRE